MRSAKMVYHSLFIPWINFDRAHYYHNLCTYVLYVRSVEVKDTSSGEHIRMNHCKMQLDDDHPRAPLRYYLMITRLDCVYSAHPSILYTFAVIFSFDTLYMVVRLACNADVLWAHLSLHIN